jgi:ribose 5-phosphate isomerase A
VYRTAELLNSGVLKDIMGVPCSIRVDQEARKLGIPLINLDSCLGMEREIDLTIDGADEVDPQLNLIKGGGGALLREKIVAQASLRKIIVVDESKLSPKLGTNWAVPVEVITFGCRSQQRFIESLGGKVTIRQNSDGTVFRTDQGNQLLDCDFGPIADPAELSAELNGRAGIIEHGLFLGLATDVIVAGDRGIQHLKRA